MRDTSSWSFTPTNFTMTQMVGLAVLMFMVGVSFMFWLGGIAASKKESSGTDEVEELAAGPEESVDV